MLTKDEIDCLMAGYPESILGKEIFSDDDSEDKKEDDNQPLSPALNLTLSFLVENYNTNEIRKFRDAINKKFGLLDN